MEKILVTTDLSANSRAALRFAIQYATQNNAELTILHVHFVLRASGWSDNLYNQYVRQTEALLRKDLERFIKSVCRSVKVEPKSYEAVLINHYETEDTIIKYAYAHKCNYIVVGIRGAGLLRKVFGTTATRMISKSPIPVILVPKNYRMKQIESVLYASDIEGEQEELKSVIQFAKPVNAKVELLHFMELPQSLDEVAAGKKFSKKLKYPVAVKLDKREMEISLEQDIAEAVTERKPSVVAMFTHRQRSLTDRILAPSYSRQFSFRTKVPLLIFNKNTA